MNGRREGALWLRHLRKSLRSIKELEKEERRKEDGTEEAAERKRYISS